MEKTKKALLMEKIKQKKDQPYWYYWKEYKAMIKRVYKNKDQQKVNKIGV